MTPGIFEVEVNGTRGWYIGTSASRALWIAWRKCEVETMIKAFAKMVSRSGIPSISVELDELNASGVRFVEVSRKDFVDARKTRLQLFGLETK